MASTTHDLIVASSDDRFVDLASRALATLAHSELSSVAIPIGSAFDGADFPSAAQLARTSAILIDSKWPEGGSLEALATNRSLEQVAAALGSEAAPPQAVRLIRACEALPAAARPTVIIAAEAPTLAFTQAALAAGCDWVWTSRSEFVQLDAVIRRLWELSRRTVRLPSVMVVENAPQDIRRLRTEIGDICKLSIVSDGLRSNKEFFVTADEAMAHFETAGPFAAAIVDLALSDQDEDIAGIEIGTEVDTVKSFLHNERELTSFLQGVSLLKRLMATGAEIPIFVMSNWLESAGIVGWIKQELGSIPKNVEFLFKDGDSYRRLRDQLQHQLSGKAKLQ
jgi:hypothetical protein